MSDTELRTISKIALPFVVASASALLLSGCLIDLGSDDTPEETTDEEVVVDDPAEGDTVDEGDVSSDEEVALAMYVTVLQEDLPAIQAEYADTYSDIQIYSYEPGGVEYAYMYLDAVDPAEAVAYFDSYIPTLQETCDTQLFPEMYSVGILEPSVTYSYYNPDGTLLWTHDFYPS